MSDVWGRPDVPPVVDEPGDILTRFQGWIESHGSTPKGYYKVTIAVPSHEKYKALRMTDLLGIQLNFEVSIPQDFEEGDELEDMLKELSGE